MGLPAKLLAEGETPLLVLRPHVRRLLRPALVLLVLAPAAAYAAGAVPPGATQPTVRAVVAGVAVLVAARWVVWPFALWWNTVYVLTDERLFERAGIVRRTGHDLPLRKVTDVVVAQRLGERVLRSGTLSVTTEGGAQFTVTDVPGVSRLQHGLLAVADDVAERFAAPPARRRGVRAGEEPGGRYLEIGPADEPDDELSADDDADDDADEPGRRDRREFRRRERENARRLRALQAQVRRTPVPDSPVEDDAAPPAPPAPQPPADADPERGQGARILRFPPRT